MNNHLYYYFIIVIFIAIASCSTSDTVEPNEQCALPYFTPPPGSYGESTHFSNPYNMNISIQCPTPNALIRYTLDGTAPNDNSEIYNTPIELQLLAVGSYKTITAYASKEGYSKSPIVTGVFRRATYNP